jgi:peptidoglycan/LPS O-acetylase OafA/YrhL
VNARRCGSLPSRYGSPVPPRTAAEGGSDEGGREEAGLEAGRGDGVGCMRGTPSNLQHIAALDELRGMAALMVLLAHVMHNLTHGVHPEMGSWIYPTNPLFAILAEGHAGVSLFMVLSGFLFGLAAFGRDVRYLPFIRNRALRILPMYVLLLSIGAALGPPPVSADAFLRAALMLEAPTFGGVYTVILWTIPLEFAFYAIFPFLNAATNRAGYKLLLSLLAVAIAYRIYCVLGGANPRDISYFTLIGRIDQFLIGLLVAQGVRRRWFPVSVGLPALLAAAAIILGSLFVFNRLGGWLLVHPFKAVWHSYEAVIFGVLIVCYTAGHHLIPSLWKRLLGYCGLVSFSLYVIHMPILVWMQSHKLYVEPTSDPFWNAFASIGVILPVVLGCASVTYYCIERPFMQLRATYLAPVVKTGEAAAEARA